MQVFSDRVLVVTGPEPEPEPEPEEEQDPEMETWLYGGSQGGTPRPSHSISEALKGVRAGATMAMYQMTGQKKRKHTSNPPVVATRRSSLTPDCV